MKSKKLLSFLLVAIMIISLLPISVFAEIGDGYGQCPHHAEHTAECGFENGGTCDFICKTCLGTVNDLVAQLPEPKAMKQMTEIEKNELGELVDKIDKAKLNLSDAARELVDWTNYDVACIVLYMPDGWFGATISKGYLKSDYTPSPQFAFLNEQGERTQALSINWQTMDVLSLDENLFSGYFYLPEGTYTVEEFVDGDWDVSMTVDGTGAENMTFSASAGSLIGVDVQNAPSQKQIFFTVYNVDLSDEMKYVELGLENALTDVKNRTNGIMEFNQSFNVDFTIDSGTFSMREDGLSKTCGGNITISGNADITIESGTYTGEITVNDGAILTIEGGTFTGNITVKSGGKLIIKGGTFSVSPTVEDGGILIAEKNITLGATALKGGQASNVYFGNYQQSSLDNTEPTTGTEGVDWIKNSNGQINGQGAYYKKDPIKWRVLSNDGSKLFLLSDKNLDVVRYHEDDEAVTWATSTIRSWLNGYKASSNTGGDSGIDYTRDNFIGSAFSENEKKK